MSAAGLRESAGRFARSPWAVPTLAIVASTVLILAPLLRAGYVLSYDMVFAPHMPLGADVIGLGAQLPRAVPSDLVVALASHVLPGDLVQKLVLAALILSAGFGAAGLAAPSALPRTVAALTYIWTPFLAERLLLGQWAVLVGYAALPWLVAAARRVRSASDAERPASWCWLVLVLGVMCLGGAPAWLLALLTAPVVLAWGPRLRVRQAVARAAGCLAALAVFALPWALPALLRPSGVRADPLGAELFAPSADTPLGVLVSLMTGGGIWNGEAIPPGRDAMLASLGALLLAVLGLAGAVRNRADPVGPLAAAGLAGLGVAIFTSWLPGARALAHLPGAALLRDSQRLLAPWVLLLALGLAAAATEVAGRVRRDIAPSLAILVLLPVAVLPTLAWGVSGRLVAVTYPAGFGAVRALIDADPRPGAVAVLPFAAYRRFAWNAGRTSMDPLSRWIDRTVIVSSDLPIGTGPRQREVRGEDPLATLFGAAVARVAAGRGRVGGAAGGLGVRWIVVDAAVDPSLLAGLDTRYRSSAVSLYEVPPGDVRWAGDPARVFAAPAAPVIAGDLLAAGVLLAAGLGGIAGLATRRATYR